MDAPEYSDTLVVSRKDFYRCFAEHWPSGRDDMVVWSYYHYEIGLIKHANSVMDECVCLLNTTTDAIATCLATIAWLADVFSSQHWHATSCTLLILPAAGIKMGSFRTVSFPGKSLFRTTSELSMRKKLARPDRSPNPRRHLHHSQSLRGRSSRSGMRQGTGS